MAASSKLEYLKRYASVGNDTEKKKKRSKKLVSSTTRFKILDDDVDFKTLLPSNLKRSLDEDLDENKPVVAGIVDERPEIVQQMEHYTHGERWRRLRAESPGNEIEGSESVESRRTYDANGNQSPHRKQRHDSDSDQSPKRKQRHDSDSDQSPKRKQRHDSDTDKSPKRKNRRDSDSDQSPKRKNRRGSDSDQSPKRKHKPDSDSDQSPKRKHKPDSDSDQSPKRKRRRDSDSDQSLKREKVRDRKNSLAEVRSKIGDNRQDSITDKPRDGKKASHTLSGATAGLSTAREMRIEGEKLRERQDKAFSEISSDMLGKGATTVLRDKSGRRRNLQAEKAEKDANDALKAEVYAKYSQWGKGMKQTEEAASRAADAAHEASKPLARYRDDTDLDTMRRDEQRAGDPMLAFVKSKPSKDVKAKPQYRGNAPPNRFNIRPGYRWDSVDRSNGFEKRLFISQSERKAVTGDAYKWSTEDM